MDDSGLILMLSATVLIAIALISMVSLKGFTKWIELKRAEIEIARAPERTAGAGGRIELADLKERIRKLEAIAAGVDL